MIVKEVNSASGGHYAWAIHCPGCKFFHLFDARWTFNGNMEKPTFTPSMNATKDWPKWHPEEGKPKEICHSYVTDGQIKFLDDCTHASKGLTLDLLEIDPMWNESR